MNQSTTGIVHTTLTGGCFFPPKELAFDWHTHIPYSYLDRHGGNHVGGRLRGSRLVLSRFRLEGIHVVFKFVMEYNFHNSLLPALTFHNLIHSHGLLAIASEHMNVG